MSKQQPNVFVPLWIFSALAVGLLGGYAIKNFTIGQKLFHPLAKFGEMDQVLFFVKHQYVDSIDIEELEANAISETLKELDPHSAYFSKEVKQKVNEEMGGKYEGVGIEFFIVEDTVTVVTAMSGGPSESVGIRAGDKIVSVNDSTIAGIGIDNSDVIRLLKGKGGTKVNVGVVRGLKEEIDFNITRGPIVVNSVEVAYMLTEDTGIIKLNQFSAQTSREFNIELNKLVKSGMKNLIIDLRNNGGGIMDDALNILDELLDGNKLLLSAKGKNYNEVYNAKRKGDFEEGKVAVLINESSASASEIVAGTIQDWDRGILIGRRSFGKGLVGTDFNLTDGSAIRLTIARYYTPSGRSIQKSYKNGRDAYYETYYNRANSGELVNKDSIRVDSSLIHYTLINKREVFGGGGITPDIFVPIETSGDNLFLSALYTNATLQEYCYNYFSNHENEFDGFDSAEEFDNQFFVSNTLYGGLIDFTKNQFSDKNFTSTQLISAKQEVNMTIKALFARQLFGDDGFYLIANQDDEDIKAALDVFENGQYEQLLNPTK